MHPNQPPQSYQQSQEINVFPFTTVFEHGYAPDGTPLIFMTIQDPNHASRFITTAPQYRQWLQRAYAELRAAETNLTLPPNGQHLVDIDKALQTKDDSPSANPSNNSPLDPRASDPGSAPSSSPFFPVQGPSEQWPRRVEGEEK